MENPLAAPPFSSDAIDGNKFSTPWSRWFAALRDFITRQNSYSVAFNPASIGANTVSRQTVTVTGLTTNDMIAVNPPALTSGLELIAARVSATNTVTLTFWNSSAGPIDEPSGTYLILSVRK